MDERQMQMLPYRSPGLTERFYEYEAYVNHAVSDERFWTDMLDGTLHHHNQNTKLGNIF